jgi:hypothetical protein
MRIGDYEFEGPLDSVGQLKEEPGLCAIVRVAETGTCVLAGVKYSTNVRAAAALLTADPTWQERAPGGELKYGVRYTGDHLEQDLKETLIDLEGQYLVPCIL